MADARTLPDRLARIAELQALRTLAGKTRLAEAQRHSDEARRCLEQREQAFSERARDVERHFAAERLDLTALGIGRAVLASLADECGRARGDFASCEAREAESRADWLRETRLSQRAEEMFRKAARHAAQKREDATVTELATLRFARSRAGA
jgi:hypothetical protein